MYLSLLFPSILALYAIYRKKLTVPGTILAWMIGFIIAYYGSYFAFGAVSLTILLIIFTDKLKKTKEDETRTIYQIISNLLTAALCIVLYSITNREIFYLMYYAVLAASLADTLSSNVGSLSKKVPVNIFTLEKLVPGSSGGVSLLGFVSALGGGIILAITYAIDRLSLTKALGNWILSPLCFIVLMGFLGSIIDTVLGTLFQAQYQCLKCKKTIETKEHCNKEAKLIKGYAFMDNNLVNFLSSILIMLLSYLFLI